MAQPLSRPSWRSLLVDTFKGWSDHNASTQSAALAFFTMFSIVPVLIVVIALAGAAFSRDAVQRQILTEFQSWMGTDAARFVSTLLHSASQPTHSHLAALLGTASLVFGATGMFVQLQDALNRVWDVTPKPGAIFTSLLRKRLLSFAVVLGLGFLLAVSLVLFTAVAALSAYLETKLQFPAKLLGTTTIVVSFLVITLLFAMIYKVLPDVRLSWRDVALGSVVTALLFEIGKALIGFYLGHTGLASVYGAAGSLVLLLSWVYYSAMIFLLGAEFTRVYSRRFHHAEVAPEKGAQKVKQIEIVAPAPAPAGGDTVSRDPMRSAR